MNKKSALLFPLLFTSIFVLGTTLVKNKAIATVGGPSYISEIAYNPLNEIVYYKRNTTDGMGCPPIIHGIDLTNKQDKELKTCYQVFTQYESDFNGTGSNKYNDYMSNFYTDLQYLGSVSLKKNHIDITVKEIGAEEEKGERMWTNFQATVLQDNKQVGKINFRGCDPQQPHLFEGYMIPDTNSMAVLISNQSDCFEGGYIGESLYVIDGIKYYDTAIVRSYKQASASEPNKGNLTIYASTGNTMSNLIINKNYPLVLGITAGVALILGIFFGVIIMKRKAK